MFMTYGIIPPGLNELVFLLTFDKMKGRLRNYKVVQKYINSLLKYV